MNGSNWFNRILVVSPHCDDETIGCGGTLAKYIALGSEVCVAIVTASDIRFEWLGRTVTSEERIAETKAAMEVLGITRLDWFLAPSHEARLDMYPRMELIQKIDKLLAEFQPTLVLYPYPSHHQDHQAVHQACEAALRPDPSSSVRVSAMYEYPYISTQFNPAVAGGKIYVELSDAHFALKMTALSKYRSQISREPTHMLSLETIEAFTKMRGREIGVMHAEAFYLLRGVLG